jgi:hypothetical protein
MMSPIIGAIVTSDFKLNIYVQAVIWGGPVLQKFTAFELNFKLKSYSKEAESAAHHCPLTFCKVSIKLRSVRGVIADHTSTPK